MQQARERWSVGQTTTGTLTELSLRSAAPQDAALRRLRVSRKFYLASCSVRSLFFSDLCIKTERRPNRVVDEYRKKYAAKEWSVPR